MSGRQIITLGFLFVAACAAPTFEAPGEGLKTAQAYCAARAEAECNGIVVQKCGVKDRASCESARSGRCVAEMPQGTTYVPEAALGCIETTKGAYADGTLTTDELEAVRAACAKVFSGPGVVRSPCTADADCSSKDNLRCVNSKCLTPRTVQPGDSCAGESDLCTAEFYCDPKSRTCLGRVGEGEDCYMKACLPGLKCQTSIFGGGCKSLATPGSPCTMDEECTSRICNKAKGTSEGTCTDKIVLSPIAAACTPFQ